MPFELDTSGSPSERAQAQATEEGFRQVVEHVVGYAIFLLDAAGCIASWNAGAERMKGYAPREIIGRHVSTFYRPEDAGKWKRELELALRDGHVEDEGWRVRRDGSLFWASVVITALRDRHNIHTGFVKVTRDLTERRRAEEALRQSEERFRSLVSNVRDCAMFMLDPSGSVATWNVGAERLTGYKAEEIVGQHFSRLCSEEEVQGGACESDLRTAEVGGRTEKESWRVRKDGSRFWASVVLTALRNTDGKLVAFAAVTQDLTDRLHAEEQRLRLAEQTAARKSDERVLSRLMQLHGLMVSLAAARTPKEIADVLVNQVAVVLGATSALFVRPIADNRLEVVAARSADPLMPISGCLPVESPVPLAAAFRSRTAEWIESREQYAQTSAELSGCSRGIASSAALPLVVRDSVLGAMGFDFVEPRRFPPDERALLHALALQAAEALDRAEMYARESATCRALEKAVRMREEVLGVVVHDLRNPINVIFMAANLLLQRLTDSTARRSAERIVRSVQRTEHLLHDLLDIEAIEAGQFSIEARRVETAGLILAALESQQPLLAAASLILSADLSPGLPPLEADEERIFQLLENLIGNATKFTKPGGTVSVGASHEGSEVLFWVKDTGPGIPAEQLPHVFDRFWQAKRADRRGSGLGLAVCKAIVEAHGGRIWAESEPDVGTTIFFTMPTHAERASSAPALQTANILLVDDRPENLLALKAMLERPDYRLVCAASGKEAIGLALRESFDLAIVDIAMPAMDGFEVTAHLKELKRGRHIPIILVTAYGHDPKEIHRAYSAGAVDYLVKPLDVELVRKKVDVFLELRRPRTDHKS